MRISSQQSSPQGLNIGFDLRQAQLLKSTFSCNVQIVASGHSPYHLALTMQDTWYVTFELHKPGILPKPRCPRRTVTVETESAARQFARAKVEEGLIVFAGTINPHLPRQLISAERIMLWIALEYSDSNANQIKK